jgi:hypothetical protein
MIPNMGISLLAKELNNVKNGQEYSLKNRIYIKTSSPD